MKKISTQPYKGTRDFYPEDMKLQKYIFNTMRNVVEKFGYQECTASVLEESDLYRAKTGEEIVNEQTYSFIDRGGRDVTLRPEMTPTVARMVANKRKELVFPVRWYSIPNCFRYERPQRGRLREFWQLNVDLLGQEGPLADTEIIQIAYATMQTFGADPENFTIKLNSRNIMNELFEKILSLNPEKSYRLSKLIDKKNKISTEEFANEVKEIVGKDTEILNGFLKAEKLEDLPNELLDSKNAKELNQVMQTLESLNITNYTFDPTLMRGFDYYTGVVFEVFDTNPKNARSLFGGGRYDNLVDIFGVEAVPAVGFGMGDVTIQDYLETYDLVPNLVSGIDITICTINESTATEALQLADGLRDQGANTIVDYSNKKVGQKIKTAEKSRTKYVICFGEKEVKNKRYVLKNIADFSEVEYSESELLNKFKNQNE